MTLSSSDTRRRVALLTAQAAALGLVIAWITVPANTIFLRTYGSGLLPLTYILSAGTGAGSSVLLARALRRRPLAAVAMHVMIASSIVLLAAWLMLWLADAAWMSFALLTILPITIPVGFMFVVGQAGALLDVRSLKVMYPRVIAGFASGFAVGGLTGAPLLEALGGPEHLLSTAAATAVVLVVLVLVTIKAFSAELTIIETPDESDKTTERPSLRSLLSNRYVVLIMAFQMLSALESQLLDFLVYDHAGRRYTNATDLASFVGRFSAIAYGADIVFLIVVAGVLLGRFGLRFGLLANPAFVLALVAASISGAILQGSASTAVFLLVVATRVSDMVLADGTTRTSVGAAYQAVPSAQRTASQAVVESLAVPLAIGVSGVVLLIVRATVGTEGLVIPVIVVGILACWIVCAISVFRGYGVNLLDTLRHRQLDPSEIVIDDAETLVVVEALLTSGDQRDVRLGLATLQRSGHPTFVAHLERMVASARPGDVAMALAMMADVEPSLAAGLARAMLADSRPDVRAAAVRTLSASGSSSDAGPIAERLLDDHHDVRLAAAWAVGRLPDDEAHRRLSAIVARGASHADPSCRAEAASMLAAAPIVAAECNAIVERLLADHDVLVVSSALGAVVWPAHEHLEAAVVSLLDGRETSPAAIEAIARAGDMGVAVVDRCLLDTGIRNTRRQELAVRAARDIGSTEAARMLARHLDHRSRDVVLAIINTLNDIATEQSSSDRTVGGDVVAVEIVHAERLLRAIVLTDDVVCAELHRSLTDELALTRLRVLSALSLHHGREAIDRVSFQLAQRDPRQHAVAIEWLELSLVPRSRPAIALLEPDLTPMERLRRLPNADGPTVLTLAEQLADLAVDEHGIWRRPWLRACAILALSRQNTGFTHLLERLSLVGHDDDLDGIVVETIDALRHRSLAEHA